MRVTNPYNNDITIINDFVTENEQELALKYFNKFFNKSQTKQEHQINDDTADFFALSNNYTISDEEYQELKPVVKAMFEDLQHRAEKVFYETFLMTDVEFTPIYNFSRLMSRGISQHADDCQPGATQTVYYGSILYWNDNFDGGELNYSTLGIKYKPVGRDLVFHPGTLEYTHGVDDVTAGTRYTSTMFVKGTV